MIRFNQLISVLMMIFVLLGCSDQQQGIQEDPSLMENETIQPKNIEIVDDYLADPQFDMTFPVDTSDDNYNSRILPSLLTNFIHFEDQGEILVTPINVDHFDLYINGYRLEIEEDSWQDGKIHKVDISPYTINGKNTIQVSNIQGEDSSVNVQIAYPKVVDGKDLYATNDTFSLIDSIIEAEVENGFTSAQLTIIKDGKIAKNSSYGYVNNYESDGTPLKENDKVKVTNDSLFDLASNTKMYATNYAIQQLVSNGDLLIDDPVSNYFPEFKDDESADIVGKDKIKIRDLLMHQAGFPADPQYHNNNFDEIAVAEDGSNALFAQDKETTKEMILQTPLVYEPGTETIYSDVDYMLLGLIVEEVSGKSLDEYVKQYFFDPLKLTQITFNPLENGFEKDQIVATELKGNTRDGVVDFDHIRTETIQGEVHDEKAFYAMDGVSGHAGLFSNSEDLAILAQVMLNGGGYEDNKFFDQKTIDEFTKPSPIDDTFGLGWRRQGASKNYNWAFSSLADKGAYGHTGWTGTLTVIDPTNNLVIVLLTSAKNSPVLDKENDPNTMLGNKYLTSNYGLISSLVYSAFEDNQSIEKNNSLLIELVEEKERQINELPDQWDNKPSLLSYNALIDVLEERGENSELINEYLKEHDLEEIRKVVEE